MQIGGIILCGGKSSRMGRDKATLPFGNELMLHRVLRLLGEVVPPQNIVVVTAAGQQLPSLPSLITVTHDRRPDRGPLEAISAGLRSLNSSIEAAYMTSCDAPLLVPAFVRRMFELLQEHDIAVPREAEYSHPLAAVYRRSVLDAADKLLASDRLRPTYLFDEVKTRYIPLDELKSVDPELLTLVNLNHPEDYRAALATAGYPADPASFV